jgi:hypothetical protein
LLSLSERLFSLNHSPWVVVPKTPPSAASSISVVPGPPQSTSQREIPASDTPPTSSSRSSQRARKPPAHFGYNGSQGKGYVAEFPSVNINAS